MQAQTADAAAERGCDIANDATDNKVLNALAVGTTDGDDLLSEESTAFIIVGFVATLGAAVGFLSRHNWLVMSLGILLLLKDSFVLQSLCPGL